MNAQSLVNKLLLSSKIIINNNIYLQCQKTMVTSSFVSVHQTSSLLSFALLLQCWLGTDKENDDKKATCTVAYTLISTIIHKLAVITD